VGARYSSNIATRVGTTTASWHAALTGKYLIERDKLGMSITATGYGGGAFRNGAFRNW